MESSNSKIELLSQLEVYTEQQWDKLMKRKKMKKKLKLQNKNICTEPLKSTGQGGKNENWRTFGLRKEIEKHTSNQIDSNTQQPRVIR